jgi:hypothetical protein
MRSSSEAEPRSRGRPAPERGGTSLEGASSPRARRNLTRGGDQPSSEAEVFRCGAVPLERSGVLREGGWAGCLVGRWVHQSHGPVSLSCVHFRFVCVLFFCESKRVFPGCLGTLMVVPDSSPRASVGVFVRTPQMLMLTNGTFFPPGCWCYFVGAALADPRV